VRFLPFNFIHRRLYSPLLGPDFFFSVIIFFTQTVGLLGRVISPSQGRYLHTGQHKQNANTDIHALSGIRTYDPNVRASEDSSCLTAGARHACARRETRLAFTCARKSSSTLLQLLAMLRRVRIRIFTRSVYRL
jgi:hypothetical protein